LLNQHGQVVMEAAAALVAAVGLEAAATLAVAAVSAVLLVAALALRQPFTEAAFEQRRPSGGRTFPGQVSAE
jgi:hypothetical protein